MEFVPGKYYKMRCGDKMYCIGKKPNGMWLFCDEKGGGSYERNSDGIHPYGDGSCDIVGEWVEPGVFKRVIAFYTYTNPVGNVFTCTLEAGQDVRDFLGNCALVIAIKEIEVKEGEGLDLLKN